MDSIYTSMYSSILVNLADKWLNPMFLIGILFLIFVPNIVIAQSGTIIGKVIDNSTGKPLSGADVVINGVTPKVTSDLDGKFILRGVPVGNYLLVVRHSGFLPVETPIIVENGVLLDQHVVLSGKIFEGDKIFNAARYQGQASSLTRQRESLGLVSSISSIQLDHFTDYTVEDGIARIPGVQVVQRGQLNIRGVGRNLYNVTIDGQRLGSTGLGDRVIDLGVFPISVIQQLDVYKVITPEMDADALGGTVNIITRRPVGTQRNIEAVIGGGANPNYFSQSGPESRASISYTDSPNDVISVAMAVYHQIDQRPWESLNLDYGVADFGNGPVDVIERITPAFQLDQRNRLGGRMQIIYQPTQRVTYHLQGMLNKDNRELISHRKSWAAGGDWSDQFTTGELGNRGSYNYDVQLQEINIQHLTVQTGAKHLLQTFDLDYNIGWSQSSIIQEEFRFPFHLGNLNYRISMGDRSRPSMEITNIPLMPDGTIDPRRIALEHIDRVFNEHVENKFSGNINIKIPFTLGLFKFGSAALLSDKDGDFNEYQYRHIRRFTLDRFSQVRNGNYNVLDQYDISHFVDPFDAKAFYTGNRPSLTLDERLHYERSDIWNYGALENIYAGYGMVSVEFGRFTFLGGARIEYTDAKYDGFNVFFDDIGTYISTNDTSQSISYTNIFPNIQLKFNPANRSNISAAYSRSLARPNFNQLAPFQLLNTQNSTLFRGNPYIDPMISDNLDVHFDHYFSNTGSFSVGLFYKELTGYVYLRERTIEEGDFSGWNERMFVNSDESATIYGIEASWQHHLAFLPGFLRNFSTYANYTWSHSELDTAIRQGNVVLPYHSPHIVNTALNYSQGRFSTQISYYWTAKFLNSLRENTQIAPSIHPTEAVYMDLYQDGWSDLSFSLRFRISNNFRYWINVSNLLNTSISHYANDRDSYPVGTYLRDGVEFNMGIRYDF